MVKEQMSSEKAMEIVAGIYNILQTIPVSGEMHISNMSGVFPALKELGEWVQSIRDMEEDGEKDDKAGG